MFGVVCGVGVVCFGWFVVYFGGGVVVGFENFVVFFVEYECGVEVGDGCDFVDVYFDCVGDDVVGFGGCFCEVVVVGVGVGFE